MDRELGHIATLVNEVTSNTTLTEICNPDVEHQTIAVAVLLSVSCVVAVVRRRRHRMRRVLEEGRKAAAGGAMVRDHWGI